WLGRARTWSARRRGLAQKLVQLAGAFKFEEIIASANVKVANPDLRHGSPTTGADTQIRAQIVAAGNVNFLESRTFTFQQVFGHVAVAAVARRVDHHLMHIAGASPRA